MCKPQATRSVNPSIPPSLTPRRPPVPQATPHMATNGSLPPPGNWQNWDWPPRVASAEAPRGRPCQRARPLAGASRGSAAFDDRRKPEKEEQSSLAKCRRRDHAMTARSSPPHFQSCRNWSSRGAKHFGRRSRPFTGDSPPPPISVGGLHSIARCAVLVFRVYVGEKIHSLYGFDQCPGFGSAFGVRPNR